MQPEIEDVIAIVKMQLGIASIGADDHLVEALGAESSDIVNIVAALEEKYDIEIDESELARLTTVSGLHRLIARQCARET